MYHYVQVEYALLLFIEPSEFFALPVISVLFPVIIVSKHCLEPLNLIMTNASPAPFGVPSQWMVVVIVLFVCVAGNAFVIERQLSGNQSMSTASVRCSFVPAVVQGQLAFGLYRPLEELCATGDTPIDTNLDAVTCEGEVPQVAVLVGGNGTMLPRNRDDVLFRGIGGSVADVTVSMESKEGWTAVLLVRLNGTADGALMALIDDTAGDTAWVIGDTAVTKLRNCDWRDGKSCLSAGLYVAVIATGATSQLHVVAPFAFSRDKSIMSFTAPSLFDNKWHLLGVTFEPLAAARYMRVSLHIDGVDPFEVGLERCARAEAAVPVVRLSSQVPTGNATTTGGALMTGDAAGSYHVLLLYREALSRRTIASFGTPSAMATAAGGNRSELFVVGFVFLGVAVALASWAAVHAVSEANTEQQTLASQLAHADDDRDDAESTDMVAVMRRAITTQQLRRLPPKALLPGCRKQHRWPVARLRAPRRCVPRQYQSRPPQPRSLLPSLRLAWRCRSRCL